MLNAYLKKELRDFTLDAELTVEDGETLALLGSNGAGKSTILRLLAGLMKPDEGRVELGGAVLSDTAKRIFHPAEERRVGYMFQNYALFPNMSVRKNVLAGMGRKPDPALADPYLERFRIADLAERFPHELSEGQKQRTAMARIVAQAPDAILLDEPFAALDTVLKWQLEQEMLQVLTQEKKPTVFVSHDISEVYQMSGAVCSMKDGKTMAQVKTGEFFDRLKKGTADLMPGWRILPPEEV